MVISKYSQVNPSKTALVEQDPRTLVEVLRFLDSVKNKQRKQNKEIYLQKNGKGMLTDN